jgi:hypothetical protein
VEWVELPAMKIYPEALRGWVPVEVAAVAFGYSVDLLRMKAIMAGRWDEKTWKVWYP